MLAFSRMLARRHHAACTSLVTLWPWVPHEAMRGDGGTAKLDPRNRKLRCECLEQRGVGLHMDRRSGGDEYEPRFSLFCGRRLISAATRRRRLQRCVGRGSLALLCNMRSGPLITNTQTGTCQDGGERVRGTLVSLANRPTATKLRCGLFSGSVPKSVPLFRFRQRLVLARGTQALSSSASR